jgi:hypothetical protein
LAATPGEFPHARRSPGRRRHLAPAVQKILAADLLGDHELHGGAAEHVAQMGERGLDQVARIDAGDDAALHRFRQGAGRVPLQHVARGDQHVDDLVHRDVGGGRGRGAGPDQGADIQPRRGEAMRLAAVFRAVALNDLSLDDMTDAGGPGDGGNDRVHGATAPRI